MLHGITVCRAVSHMKMPPVREYASSLLGFIILIHGVNVVHLLCMEFDTLGTVYAESMVQDLMVEWQGR